MRFLERIFGHAESRTLRERITYPLSRLQTQQKKIEQISLQLRRRDQDLFDKCVESQRTGDLLRAHMYADECAEIRRIARLVLANQLVLEKVVVRLETLMHFGDVVGKDLASVVGLVRELGVNMSGVIPAVANELNDINSSLTDMTEEAGRVKGFDISGVDKEETGRVLLEATTLAELRMKEQYEQLPEIEAAPRAAIQVPRRKASTEAKSLETRVYEYVMEHTGKMSLAKCASTLGVSTADVERCLERLVDQGRIALERE